MNRTPLYDTHKNLGAKMVNFGGWDMPVSYSGVLKEHEAVRSKAGLFDVSHMGEIRVEGEEALAFLQHLTCNDLSKAKDGQCQYNILMNEQGGAVDDIIVNRIDEKHFLVCVNASNAEKDWEWMNQHAPKFKAKLENQSADYALIALQGPLASKILSPFADVSTLKPFHFAESGFAGKKVLIARTGYTGEDGFEIYCKPDEAAWIWEKLLEEGKPLGLLPCGLGARDTLRLEMAYPLYGHELSEELGPLEAGLDWVVKIDKGDFIGKAALLRKKEQGVSPKRVGIMMQEDGIAREGYPLFSGGEKVGRVVSGTYSPSLDKNIACGYVRSDIAKIGAEISVEIRGKKKLAQVLDTPFYKRKY